MTDIFKLVVAQNIPNLLLYNIDLLSILRVLFKSIKRLIKPVVWLFFLFFNAVQDFEQQVKLAVKMLSPIHKVSI